MLLMDASIHVGGGDAQASMCVGATRGTDVMAGNNIGDDKHTKSVISRDKEKSEQQRAKQMKMREILKVREGGGK